MDKLKISFDFDSTLDTEQMQILCKKFKQLGAEIYVVTSRATHMHGGVTLDNSDLFQVTDALGIDRNHITFTQYEDKYHFVKDFDMHFDDDHHEIYLINQHPGPCLGILYEQYQRGANGVIDY